MMKTIVLALFLALFAFVQTQYAQSPEKILKKATKALGGEKALRSIRTRQATGKIIRTSDSATGNFQTNQSNPNLYSRMYDLGGLETSAGYNGKSAWQRDSKIGLQTLTGAETRDFQAVAVYRNLRWLDYKKQRAKVFSGGRAEINGKLTDSVIFTTAKNAKIKIYFDTVSGLPAREEIPAGTDAVEVFDYSDYRIVDGINEPFAVDLILDNQKYSVKFEQIVRNREIAKSVFDFPIVSSEPLPEISELLKAVAANEDRVDEILENYTYTETQAKREVGSDGTIRQKEVEKRQVTFYKGNQIRRLIAKDGKPLSPNEIRNEDKKAADAVEDIEKKISRRESRAAANASAKEAVGDSGERISIGEILRASNLKNPRRELFRNRDVIVFDFEPNPAFDYKNAKSLLKFFGKTAGAIWIDEKDKQVARVEAVLIDNFKVGGGLVANLKKGASFTLEQNRVNDEIWLPVSADINLSIKVLLVKGININQLVTFSDYQRFKSEVKGAKVGEGENP